MILKILGHSWSDFCKLHLGLSCLVLWCIQEYVCHSRLCQIMSIMNMQLSVFSHCNYVVQGYVVLVYVIQYTFSASSCSVTGCGSIVTHRVTTDPLVKGLYFNTMSVKKSFLLLPHTCCPSCFWIVYVFVFLHKNYFTVLG